MKSSPNPQKNLTIWNTTINRDMIGLIGIWIILVGGSLFWNIHTQQKTSVKLALSQAEAGFERDQLFRRWGASMGGTYVPITETTQPNRYLKVPERDISTPSGLKLTLLNPAYMMRQINEMGEESDGIHGHLTSLMPLRPENAADSWEAAALRTFEEGATEMISVELFQGEPHLRLMRPFVVTKVCLKCHAHQGYKIGDIRGGTSISVALAPFQAMARTNIITTIAWHFATWILGVLGIVMVRKTRLIGIRKLAANEKKLNMITRTTADAVVMMDPSGKAAYWNPAAENMFGYTREEILGKDIHQILTPDRFRKTATEAYSRFLMNGKGGAIGKPVELKAVKKDGTEFPMEMTLDAIQQEDGWWAISIIRDITERKRTEKVLENSHHTTEKILESLPVGVAIIGKDRIVRHLNSTALTMIGGDSAKEVIGQKCHKSLCPSNQCKCPILDLGQIEDSGERILINTSGQEVPILKTVVPIAIDGEEVLLETFVDISEQKMAEQNLEAAKEEAENANRTKSQFLASMSHELRTPLTGILGFTDLMLNSEVDDSKRREYLGTIRSSGKHLLRLINDILDLSKIEEGKLGIDRSDCSPHQILNEVVSILRAQALAKGVELHCNWTSLVPSTINTDPYRVHQILFNLVGNAVKFTSSGAVKVVAHLDNTQENPMLIVDVIDSGVGIPQDKLDCIFQPFVQADDSITREFGGSGLGLAISVRLAEALGGGISVTSEVGKGSKFSVSVDAGDLSGVELLSSPPAEGIQAGQETILPGKLTGIQNASILLVEDGEINRVLISTVLQEAGFYIEMAENGKIGVDKATTKQFDLILMDMRMPVLDGYSATSQLRNLGYDMPIVALTAHAMKGEKEKCLASGCSHYLSKPIDIQKLLTTVVEALSQTQGQEGKVNHPNTEVIVTNS